MGGVQYRPHGSSCSNLRRSRRNLITLRCTQRLLKRLRSEVAPAEHFPTAVLGDWYANLLATRPSHLALCVNERSLLSVVVPVADTRGFVARFQRAAVRRLWQIPASSRVLSAEEQAMGEMHIGRTRSRSVLATMTQLAFAAQVRLQEEPTVDLDELGLWLCDTPCSALTTYWPLREAVALLGQVGTNRAQPAGNVQVPANHYF
ncbi:MAG: hypothetical protein ABR543_13115 [Gemmatimonadaceae bacterium]